MEREEIEYALAKQIVEGRAITISTDYGDVRFEANETKEIISAAEKVLKHKLMMLEFIEGSFEIELNENCEPNAANAFLLYEGNCVGGADKSLSGVWNVDISIKPESEIAPDCEPVGAFSTQEQALKALWGARFLAYTGQLG